MAWKNHHWCWALRTLEGPPPSSKSSSPPIHAPPRSVQTRPCDNWRVLSTVQHWYLLVSMWIYEYMTICDPDIYSLHIYHCWRAYPFGKMFQGWSVALAVAVASLVQRYGGRIFACWSTRHLSIQQPQNVTPLPFHSMVLRRNQLWHL